MNSHSITKLCHMQPHINVHIISSVSELPIVKADIIGIDIIGKNIYETKFA